MIEVLYFAIIFLSIFSVGKKILDMFRLNMDYLGIVVFSSAIGLGIFSYLTLFLGVVGLLYKEIFLFLILGILIFSKNELLYLLDNLKITINKIKKLKGINLTLFVIFCVFAVLNLIASLSPPYLWDEVAYNIALPKIYAHHHRIIPIYDELRSNFPFNINMLFTLGLVVGNSSLAKLFMFSYGTLLALAIFSFSKRYFSLRSALLAMLVFYTMPMISNHISSTYIDIGVAFYVFMAYYAFYSWFENNKRNWLLLSSVLTGLSLASKHTALYYIPALCLGILYNLFFRLKNNLWGVFKKTATYFLIALLIVSPWYIKSYVYTGDPVYPFGYSISGGKYLKSVNDKNLIDYNFGDVALKRSLFDFLIKFWDLTMQSSKYGMLLGFGPLFLVFIPLLIFMKKVDTVIKYLLVYSLISFAVWYFNPQGLRYLMIYPMLSVVSGTVINSLLKIKKVKGAVILVLISTLFFNLVLWYGANSVKLPYVFGLESEQEFYLKLKDNNGYNVFKYANENLPKNSKLLLFGEIRGYLSDLDYIKSDPLAHRVIDYSKIVDSKSMYNELRRLGITHVLVNSKLGFIGLTNPNQPVRHSEKDIRIMNETLKNYAKLLYSENGVYLYELGEG